MVLLDIQLLRTWQYFSLLPKSCQGRYSELINRLILAKFVGMGKTPAPVLRSSESEGGRASSCGIDPADGGVYIFKKSGIVIDR